MAGEWLKFDCSLPEKPETLAITVAMGWDDPDLTVGKLMRLFRWFDQHTVDGNAGGVTPALLDRLIGAPGFVQAVSKSGWLVVSDTGLTLHNFDRHNGVTAKTRAQTAKRVANYRASDGSNDGSNAGGVTDALAREEKRREDLNTATSIEVARARRPDEPQLALVEGGQEKPWAPPPCPHLEVLALWAEVLPALPQHEPAQWKGSRADHLRARWRETAEDKRWPDQAAGLAYFRKLFVYVGKSQFLTGRAPTREGKRPFFVELEWLVKPMSWAKLIEGKYHSEAA